MKINNTFFIQQVNSTKSVITNLFDGRTKEVVSGDTNYEMYRRILMICRKRKWSDNSKNNALERIIRNYGFGDAEVEACKVNAIASTTTDTTNATTNTTNATTDTPVDAVETRNNALKDACGKLLNFFSEFGVTPSMRFVNTFAKHKNRKEYVMNYFTVQDHNYTREIVDKCSSPEFKEICETFDANPITKDSINSRFKIYYGEPGTGKTTQAVTESNKCMVCSSDMLPSDLMQNFAFADGKAEFQKSDLWIAMENGETIVMDEFNMLPFESLRFLQGITDGKETINYKGFEIKIDPNFNIIGTMNLTVGGQQLAVPAPLVDRCSDIVEFKMNADTLMRAIV